MVKICLWTALKIKYVVLKILGGTEACDTAQISVKQTNWGRADPITNGLSENDLTNVVEFFTEREYSLKEEPGIK